MIRVQIVFVIDTLFEIVVVVVEVVVEVVVVVVSISVVEKYEATLGVHKKRKGKNQFITSLDF